MKRSSVKRRRGPGQVVGRIGRATAADQERVRLFHASLAWAGRTGREWASSELGVSWSHVYQTLHGLRPQPSPRVESAVDDFIREQMTDLRDTLDDRLAATPALRLSA